MIESPCKRHCCLDGNNVCLGCHRSLEEIRQWGESDSIAKQAIIENAQRRRHNTQVTRNPDQFNGAIRIRDVRKLVV